MVPFAPRLENWSSLLWLWLGLTLRKSASYQNRPYASAKMVSMSRLTATTDKGSNPLAFLCSVPVHENDHGQNPAKEQKHLHWTN